MRPGLNVIVEFFGVRPPKHVQVLKFVGFHRNEGREREKSLLLNTASVALRGSFDGCTRANAFWCINRARLCGVTPLLSHGHGKSFFGAPSVRKHPGSI